VKRPGDQKVFLLGLNPNKQIYLFNLIALLEAVFARALLYVFFFVLLGGDSAELSFFLSF